jgi:hypothetical protein
MSDAVVYIERGGPNDDVGPLYVLLDGVYFHRAPVRPAPQPRGYVVECVPAGAVSRLEALKARLRQEVDAHRMTLHDRALPFTDEEWQGYLSGIPGLEEGR